MLKVSRLSDRMRNGDNGRKTRNMEKSVGKGEPNISIRFDRVLHLGIIEMWMNRYSRYEIYMLSRWDCPKQAVNTSD